MTREYRAIVLGLGGIGSGAAYWLSRRLGGDVLGIEQFEIGHDRGGSQDHSRIIRYSYHDPAYVDLAKHAYQAWASLEEDAGERLIVRTGGLDLFPPDAVLPLPNYVKALSDGGIPFETLDAAAIRRRWPVFTVGDEIQGLFQPDGGIAPAAKCNAAHIRMAREHGAKLIDNTPVTAIRAGAGEVEVEAGGVTYRGETLILASGAWTASLARQVGVELPLKVTQEQVTYFISPRLDDFMPDRFPIWIWLGKETCYGFPVYGERAVKVAQDLGGREVTAETRSFEPDAEVLARVEGFLARVLPAALGPALYTKTCLYTLTPDRDFIISTLPGHPNIALAVGAGHAFKFASVIGKALGELVIDGAAACDVSCFAVDRPILREATTFQNFIV